MAKFVPFDLEADGFDATKIHVISANFDGTIRSTNNYDNMRKLLSRGDITLVVHNGIRFDVPTLERILRIKVKCKIIDTLILSWYLYPERVRHGLEWWGEDFGVPKPKIDDWENLTYEEYTHRCEEDVKIQTRLWDKIWLHLRRLYGSEDAAMRCIEYLMWKLDCARQQEELGWKLDVPKAKALQAVLSERLSEATERLASVMPDVPIVKVKKRPAKPFKKCGGLSAHGERWFSLLEELGLPEDTQETSVVDGYNPPNPASDPQIKDWLYSLGWEPCTHKFVRNKETGDTREIPQVRKKNDDNEAILTPSVERLMASCPEVAALKDVGILKHRLSVVDGFLSSEVGGYIRARIKGLTNTMRFQHTEIVNLPGVDKPYGEDLRGMLICEDDEILVGCDVSSLEDCTGNHYMYQLDPDYVEEKTSGDFDPHIKMAVVAGMITEEEAAFYAWYKENH